MASHLVTEPQVVNRIKWQAWVRFNDGSREASATFDSQEEAVAFVNAHLTRSDKSALGGGIQFYGLSE